MRILLIVNGVKSRNKINLQFHYSHQTCKCEDCGHAPAECVQEGRPGPDRGGGEGAEDHDRPAGGEHRPPGRRGEQREVEQQKHHRAARAGRQTLLDQQTDLQHGTGQEVCRHLGDV